MSNELKPCPFCGDEASLFGDGSIRDRYHVVCDICYAETSQFYTEQEAIDAWNTRAYEKHAYVIAELQPAKGSEIPTFKHRCSECGGNVGIFMQYCPTCGARLASLGGDSERAQA